jgi:hypothetical protein
MSSCHWQITKFYFTYSSKENAIVERSNKEINRHLLASSFHTNTVDNYQLGLPFVQRIINS